MAKRNHGGYGTKLHAKRKLQCEFCKKPEEWFAQKENLEKHMRVFHRGGI